MNLPLSSEYIYTEKFVLYVLLAEVAPHIFEVNTEAVSDKKITDWEKNLDALS